MKSKAFTTAMLLAMLLAVSGLSAQPIVGYSGFFTFNTKYKITGIVKNASNEQTIQGAFVQTMSYCSQPTGHDGFYRLFVPPGYSYSLNAYAQNYQTQYIHNVHVTPGAPVAEVNFQLSGQGSFSRFRFREFAQAPNPANLKIPSGGTGYVWFVVEGKDANGRWWPVSNATIGVIDQQGNPVLNKNGQAIKSNQLLYNFLVNPFYVESYGHFCVPIKTSMIQNGIVGQQEQFKLISVNGQDVLPENYVTFNASIVPYEFSKSWGFRVYAKGGVGVGSITGIARANGFVGGGMGAAINVRFYDPINTNNWTKFSVARKTDLFTGVEASIGLPKIINTDLLSSNASMGITASFPYQTVFNFDMDEIEGLEAALAFYLFYEPTIIFAGSSLPGGQIGVSFLNWIVQVIIANSGQNGLGIARESDAAGLDIAGNVSAEIKLGFDLAKSLDLEAAASLGAKAHFGAYVENNILKNELTSKIYLGGGYDFSFGIGPKIVGNDKTEAKLLYPFRLNQLPIPTSLEVEFGCARLNKNNYFKHIELEASLESNSQLLNIYNLPGQRQKYTTKLQIDKVDMINLLMNVAEIPSEVANIGQTAVDVAIDDNSFKEDIENFLQKVYEEQQDDKPVVLDYAVSVEDKTEYKIDMEVQFPIVPPIDIVIGGGLEANSTKEYDLVEGFWVKGVPYFRTELPNPVNPNLSFTNVMGQLWQNVINGNLMGELVQVIIAQIANSLFFKWLNPDAETQLVVLNEQGSTLEIRKNSIPASVDSVFCRQWDWCEEPTDDLSKTDQRILYERYAVALRKIREEAVGMNYGIGGFYCFEPVREIFGDSTKLTIAYSDDELTGVDENSLRMYWEDTLGFWHPLESIILPESNKVSAWIKNFTTHTLAPRMPHGNYGLQTQPDSIHSDGISTAIVSSPILLNNDSTQIAENTLFTIKASRGEITTEDFEPSFEGIQIPVVNGKIQFGICSDFVASPIILNANSISGYAKCEGILKLFDTIPPEPPGNLWIIVNNQSVNLYWDEVDESDIAGYKIYFDTDSNTPPYNGIATVHGLPSPVAVGKTDYHKVVGLFNDTTYYFVITAFDIAGNESVFSDYVSGTPKDRSMLLSLNNMRFFSNSDKCYSANESVITANSTFKEQSYTTLISGQNILFKNGTKIENGAYLKAYIDTTGSYCQSYINQNLNLNNLIINPPYDTCFAAIRNISASDFSVEDGATATFVAGESIQLQAQVQIMSGAEFKAYIDKTGNYCQQPESMIAALDGAEEVIYEWPAAHEVEKEKQFFSLFPNPTPGTFTLQLKVPTESVITVEIYSMLGERILQTQLSGQQQYEFDLSSRPGGVYLVRVVRGEEVGVEKVVKQ